MRKSRPAPARRRTPRQLTARITGDRRAAEILQLEMRRLARRLGLTVASVRVRRVNPPST